MQGHKQFVDKVVLRFQLSERVPKHNLYRRLSELLDWEFLYAQTQPFYSHTGQPSLDPVVFFKLMLVSRLENLVSDRRLLEPCSLRLDIRYFLGYEVDEELPWHSTISRTRQLYPAAVFEHLFEHVFAQCVAAGLVTGHTQAVDSAFAKANASLESLCEKQSAEVTAPTLHVAGEPVTDAPGPLPSTIISSPAHQLQRLAATHARYLRNDSGPLGRGRPQARLLSNKTHYSPADPDARISVKPGKARALNYLCSLAVDEAHGVISHVQADLADQRDCTLLPSIVTPLHQRLTTQGLPLREVAADINYSNGVNYALLEAQGLTPWIPVFGKYKPQMEGFSYNQETDYFTCPAGKQLLFKCFDADPDGRLSKRYSASSRDCRLCPRKPTCAPKSTKRKITRTAYDAQYRRALARQQSRPGRRMRRLRQRTVDPVFSSLLQHYGLRRVNTRGRSSAHKTMLLTAIAFNLKKLLKHQPKKTLCLAIALPVPSPKGHFLRCWKRRYSHHNRLGNGETKSSATVTAPFGPSDKRVIFVLVLTAHLMRFPTSLQWLCQFTLVAALLCPLAYWGLDYPVANWVTRHLQVWQEPVATLTAYADALVQGPLFYLHGFLVLSIMFLGARLLSRRSFFTLLFLAVVLRVSSEISANILKSFVHRARPGSYATFADSFPSGHTTIYFGTFLLFAACFPRYRGWILVVPTFIALGRVIESLHYVSDVCAGMALAGVLTILGLSIAYLIDRLLWRNATTVANTEIVASQ